MTRKVLLALSLMLGAGVVLPSLTSPAQAHPFETNIYSLRNMVKLSESGTLTVLVVLEVPMQVVLSGLGVEEGDSRRQRERALEAWNQSTWDTLGAGMSLSIDGKPAKGQWLPIEHPANGKGAEGFFIYMVGFQLDQELPAQGFALRIESRSYPDQEMVYSGSATAQGDWVVVKDSSRDVLGDNIDTPLSNPGRWSKDPVMRDLEIVVERKQ